MERKHRQHRQEGTRNKKDAGRARNETDSGKQEVRKIGLEAESRLEAAVKRIGLDPRARRQAAGA